MSRASIIVLTLLWLAGTIPASAEGPPAPQCWTPAALAGTEAELKHVHSRQSLDLTPLKQVTLPPATPIGTELRGSIRGVTLPPGEKLIALTFDLCEENGYVSGYDGRGSISCARKASRRHSSPAANGWRPIPSARSS